MTHICRFDTRPATVNDGGCINGRHIVWLNLSVTEPEDPMEYQAGRFQSVTDRIVMPYSSLGNFLEAADPVHLSSANDKETGAILYYFKADDDIENWKAIRRAQIRGYDMSGKVNSFYLDDIPAWLDKATRVGLTKSITDERNAGRTVTTIWAGLRPLSMGIDTALSFLSRLELYAVDCYNNTSRHLAAVESATSIDELRAFDLSSGYPEPLRFDSK